MQVRHIKNSRNYSFIRYQLSGTLALEYHHEYDRWQLVEKIFIHPFDGHMVTPINITRSFKVTK